MGGGGPGAGPGGGRSRVGPRRRGRLRPPSRPSRPAAAAAAAAWGLVEADGGSGPECGAAAAARRGKRAGECRRQPLRARAAGGADSSRRSRALRGCPQPWPASFGRGPARAPLAAAGPGCAKRCAPWGPDGRAGYGGPAGSEGAAWPLPSGPAGTGAHSPLPRVPSWRPTLGSPLRPPPEVVAGAGSAGPLVVHRVGPGPLSLALAVGSACGRLALSLPSFFPSSPRCLGAGCVWPSVPLATSQVPAGVPGD